MAARTAIIEKGRLSTRKFVSDAVYRRTLNEEINKRDGTFSNLGTMVDTTLQSAQTTTDGVTRSFSHPPKEEA